MLSNTLSNEEEEDVQEELRRLQEETVRFHFVDIVGVLTLTSSNRLALRSQKGMSICPTPHRRRLFQTRY